MPELGCSIAKSLAISPLPPKARQALDSVGTDDETIHALEKTGDERNSRIAARGAEPPKNMFHTQGKVKSAMTTVGGDLYIGSVRIDGGNIAAGAPDTDEKKTEYALDLSSMEVSGNTFLGPHIQASKCVGEGAIFKKDFIFDGGESDVTARIAEGKTIDGITFTDSTFGQRVALIKIQMPSGIIDLRSSKIEGTLECLDVRVAQLACYGMRAKRLRMLRSHFGASEIPGSGLVLRSAEIGTIEDDRASRPGVGRLLAAGLKVGAFEQNTLDPEVESVAKLRLSWVKGQSTEDRIAPGAWQSLARFLDESGRQGEAKHVRFELKREQARATHCGPARWWRVCFAWLQEEPLLILVTIVTFTLSGAGFFWTKKTHFSETSESAYLASN